MESVLALAFAAGPVVIFAYGAMVLSRDHYLQFVDSKERGENNDSLTKKHFLALLRDAKKSIVIYDDGNKLAGSIYVDPEILRALQQKLEETPGFEVQCLFNCSDPDLPFRTEFSQHSSVKIRTRASNKPEFPVHYKIIDGGEKAYLSSHGLGETKREFQIVDCTAVPRWYRRYAKDTILRDYKQDFNRAFAEATP